MKSKKEYTLTIGINDKIALKQLLTIAQAKNIIINNTMAICGGYTLYKCEGGYINNAGIFTKEKSFRLILNFVTKNNVLKLIKVLKKELNQESIMVDIREVNLQFI